MEGWKLKPLGEVCNFIGGGTPSKANAAFYVGDIPWATVRDMKAEVLSETEFKISKQAVIQSSTNVIPGNNVIIATRVGLGKVCLLVQDTAINQDLRGIIPKDPRELDVFFLLRWFQSVASLIEDEGTGFTVKGVKLPFVKSLKIPILPLPEQQRIVAILDEAFDGIGAAVANAEKNLANARELFESYLNAAFTQKGKGWVECFLGDVCFKFGRGKSKHRPRNDPQLYGGPYPFIQTSDISGAEHIIQRHTQSYSEIGLRQSKLWPKGTICLAIVGATIGETGILTFDACFPDSVIGMVVDEEKADADFLEYLLQYFKSTLKAKGKGSARDNINLGTFRNQKFPFPPVSEQKEIASRFGILANEACRLEAIYQQRLDDLAELKQSILQKAFSGELTSGVAGINVVQFPKALPGITTTDLHAGILAIAYQRHESKGRQRTFGHVKAEKIAHLVEVVVGVDLGRNPIKDAAGPNDYPHLKKVEFRAKMAGFYEFEKRRPEQYRLRKFRRFDELVERTRRALGAQNPDVDKVIDLLLPMDTRQAEIFVTVFAAWNNLLIDGCEISGEAIVFEARDNWHPEKLKIPREKFFKAIDWAKRKNLIPMGVGRKVADRTKA